MWLKIVEHTYWCCASVTGFHLDMVQWHMSGIKNITTCKYWQHVAIIRPNSNFWLVCVYCAHNAFMRMQPRIVVISVVQVYWVAPLYGGLVCESMHNCYQDQSMQSSIWSCYIRLRARFITNQIPSQYHLDMSVIWHKFCMVLRLKYMCFFSWYASAWMVSRKEKKKNHLYRHGWNEMWWYLYNIDHEKFSIKRPLLTPFSNFGGTSSNTIMI